MTRILVVCGAGASSSFLVYWMRKDASARDLALTIRAGSTDDLPASLADTDFVLVGHHLAAAFPSIRAASATAGVPVTLLPSLAFNATGAAVAVDLVLEQGAPTESNHG
ncbi:PTS system cellobiose-specific IIB component [Marisediminicola sp. UYEF4]|uniref:PTS sugar transporter subunit IIB n=1 Tax=Marisediminicola sp. UYEF4 TaxID=1756384 RepID=UPI0033917095